MIYHGVHTGRQSQEEYVTSALPLLGIARTYPHDMRVAHAREVWSVSRIQKFVLVDPALYCCTSRGHRR